MNKNIKIIFNIISFVILVIVFCICLFLLLNKPKTSMKIFYNSINSIVELKAETEGYGESFGTASFISKDGKLITPSHVVTYKRLDKINEYEKYFIRFANETKYRKAKLLKYDSKLDLACLQLIDKEIISINPLNIRHKKVEYGEKIYSIGNALNQGISITQGIISLPLVSINYDNLNRKLIQMNIVINEGNSGGPILDKYGYLIGISSFRIRDNMGRIVYGLGYCVPVENISLFLINV